MAPPPSSSSGSRRKKTLWSAIKTMPLTDFTLICFVITLILSQLEAFVSTNWMSDLGFGAVDLSAPDLASNFRQAFYGNLNGNLTGTNDPVEEGYAYDGGTAFCLLTMDDNDIMTEWVGYHYHVLKMRRLIVAVDPNSKTSPKDILRPWTKEGSNGKFDLKVDVWENDSFMPDYFQKDYSRYRLMSIITVDPEDEDKATGTAADIELKLVSTQYHNESFTREHPDKVREALHKVSDHRFRQPYFVYKCFQTIKEEREESDISWAVHVDTDEYLVPNPWIKHHLIHDLPINTSFVDPEELESFLPAKPHPDSVAEFFHRYLLHSYEKFRAASVSGPIEKGCVMLPRVMFGSAEDFQEDPDITVAFSKATDGETLITEWPHRNFESLRWKYHQDFAELHPGGAGMKGMINVDKHDFGPSEGFFPDAVPSVFPNIHRPSKRCRRVPYGQGLLENPHQHEQPLAIYHYLGSLERYQARGDTRRKAHKHTTINKVSSHMVGDSYLTDEADRWWIKGWFDSFVETHGADAAYSVFGAAYAERMSESAAASAERRTARP